MRIFVVSSGIKNHKTDILKVFSQSLQENVVVFKAIGQRTAPISCIYAIGVPTSILIAYYRCGALYRLLSQGFTTTFL